MMKPIRTSTPKEGVRRVKGRKGIHDPPCPSPINTKNPLNFDIEHEEHKGDDVQEKDEEGNETDESDDEKQEENDEISKGEECNEEECTENLIGYKEGYKGGFKKSNSMEKKIPINKIKEIYENVKKEGLNLIPNFCLQYKLTLPHIILIIIITLTFLCSYSDLYSNNQQEINKKLDIKEEMIKLKLNYPNLNANLWLYITSSIREVLHFNKPSVILFLYLESQEKLTNELIKNVSHLAHKILDKNENAIFEPLIINGNDLNTNKYQNDFGMLIEDYKEILEKQHVLAVKNLESVSAKVSQAFHYLCDEFNPLVKKSFIIFTVKVKEFIGKEIDQAGIVLRNVWDALDNDKLEPLVARVTNLVLRINPEQN